MKRSRLESNPEKVREFKRRAQKNSRPKRAAVSPASPMQRLKVAGQPCVNCAAKPCDPAHLTSRAQGGCSEPACVISLCRECHRAFDQGRLDLAPILALPEFWVERAHMAEHLTFPQALHRLTGVRWGPEEPLFVFGEDV